MNAHTSSFRASARATYKPLYYAPRIKSFPKPLPSLKTQPGAYAVALAHELRNPLTTINLAVGMLETAMKDDELSGYLAIIKRGSVRINNLLNELLRSRSEEEPDQEYSIQQLLDEVLETAMDRILLNKVSVSREYGVQDYRFEMNRPKMKIALTNIVINAIEAMPPGKGRLKLAVYSIAGKYNIRIEDNGCGISEANLKNIFQPYFTGKPGGLGLGLSTTYDILTSSHVGVHVESELGKGTSFTLCL